MNIQSNTINLNPLPSPVKPSGRSTTSGTDPAANEAENKNQTKTQNLTFSDQTVDQDALFKSLESSENTQKTAPKNTPSQQAINAYQVNAQIPEQQAREAISLTFGFNEFS